MLRRRTTDTLNEVVSRIRAVQRRGARTHLRSKYLVVLCHRNQRLLRLSSQTFVEQRLQDRPADDPERFRCLRAVGTCGGGHIFVDNVLVTASPTIHAKETRFQRFRFTTFCGDHFASENISEQVRRFCGDALACPELLASFLERPTNHDELL